MMMGVRRVRMMANVIRVRMVREGRVVADELVMQLLQASNDGFLMRVGPARRGRTTICENEEERRMHARTTMMAITMEMMTVTMMTEEEETMMSRTMMMTMKVSMTMTISMMIMSQKRECT
jgi:hypothetical protein